MTAEPGAWGLYPWFAEHGAELVHPDDLEGFQALMPYGKLFQVAAQEGEFLALRYGDERFRVRPGELFQPRPAPAFAFGDAVQVPKKGPGTVAAIEWHHQRQAPLFFVAVDGKRLKKRYGAEDLAPA